MVSRRKAGGDGGAASSAANSAIFLRGRGRRGTHGYLIWSSVINWACKRESCGSERSRVKVKDTSQCVSKICDTTTYEAAGRRSAPPSPPSSPSSTDSINSTARRTGSHPENRSRTKVPRVGGGWRAKGENGAGEGRTVCLERHDLVTKLAPRVRSSIHHRLLTRRWHTDAPCAIALMRMLHSGRCRRRLRLRGLPCRFGMGPTATQWCQVLSFTLTRTS